MKVFVLVAVTAAAWGLTVPAAALLDGSGHWLAGSAAAVICLLPAIGTLLMLTRTENLSVVASLGAVMIAPLLRMMVVIAVGFVVGFVVPALRESPARFAGWLLAFYLITLVSETALLVTRAVKRPGENGTNGS